MSTIIRPAIYLIRHGETDWNAEGRLQGGKDIPLNDLGRMQAAEAARRLMKIRPDFADLDYVASPLSRAQETMTILRRVLGLHEHVFRSDERLRELTFGDWEGLTWPELKARDPVAAKARRADKWNYAPPSGESYAMLAERVQPWLGSLTRETVAVAHGGIARVLMVMIAGITPHEAAEADIRQGQILVFENGKARWA
jgi:broad specificity phosphatase PhoE